MRSISAAKEAVLTGSAQAQHLVVETKDSGGTWRDLTTYPGFNAVDSASWRESVDDPGMTATINLKREIESLSLATFMEDSALNRAFHPGNSYNPLIYIGREIRIKVAVVPADVTPSSGDYEIFFHGLIDTIDDAAGDQIVLECRDLSARLADTFIEQERIYCASAASTRGVRMWEPNTSFATSEFALPTQSKLSGYIYEVTSPGTTGTIEPGDPAVGGDPTGSWPTGVGATVESGTVEFTRYNATTIGTAYPVEDVISAIANEDMSTSFSLYTPVSPSWDITWFKQQRESVLQAVRKLANQIGWDIRYKWRSGTSQFEPTLYEPDRSSPSVVRTFGASDYESITSLKLDISGIRNVVKVIYSDAADTWPDGTPKRKFVMASDATSIADFGRRFMEIAESSASNIDSQTEAQTMATAIVTDLATPVFEKSVVLSYGFPYVELGDYYTFTANGRHYDSDQSLAVVGYSHEFQDGVMRTTLDVRGTPAGGYARWHALDTRNQPEDSHATTIIPFPAKPTATIESVVGGQRVIMSGSPDKRAQFPVEWEHHFSTSSGFTPSGSTLYTVTRAKDFTVGSLVPGKTYYHKAIPLTRNGTRLVRGQPTAETSFTAGRASAGHANTSVNWAQLPLNGGFETQLDASAPPDHWNVTTGAWSTNFSLVSDANGLSSGSYLQATAASTTARIASDLFPLVGNSASASSAWLQISAWMKRVSGTNAGSRCSVRLEQLTYDQTSISTTELGFFTGSGSTNWLEYGNEVLTHASARWGRIIFEITGNTETFTAYIDNVTIERKRARPAAGEDASAGATNTTSGTFATLRSVTFTQLTPLSRVVAFFNASMYASVASDQVDIRLMFNGSTQGTRTFRFNTANQHHTVAFVWEFQGAETSGPYTLTAEWRLNSGTRIDIDGNDSMSLVAFEVR